MADWTSLDTNTLLPGEPVTSAIMLALEENPRAIADGATGAPKIASKTLLASGATVTFAGLDDFSGIWIFGSVKTGLISGGSAELNIQFSTNEGSTFSGNFDYCNYAGGLSANDDAVLTLNMFVDFATGVVKSAGSAHPHEGDPVSDTNSWATSVTMTGASLDITDIRLSGNATSYGVLAMPQGGESAS